MGETEEKPLCIAIACGGTGGHLFPGLAVADELKRMGARIKLMISDKAIDREGTRTRCREEILTLPAIALQERRNWWRFGRQMWRSMRQVSAWFKPEPPSAVLAMGGFTSLPAIWGGSRIGAACFLHEANSIPGWANRLLARSVDEVFLGFAQASTKISGAPARFTGTPVRCAVRGGGPEDCRKELGLAPERPVLLITGGSQGARAINALVRETVPRWSRSCPALQYLHLCGAEEAEPLRQMYASLGCSARVWPFLDEMHLALGAATLVLSRAGASSLAELAAYGRAAILIPYPSARGNHQYYNGLSFTEFGAAWMLEQGQATPELLGEWVENLLEREDLRDRMSKAMQSLHRPHAAEEIAERLMEAARQRRDGCWASQKANLANNRSPKNEPVVNP